MSHQAQGFVQLVKQGFSFNEALARSSVAGVGSFNGLKFYFMADDSRVWKDYVNGGVNLFGAPVGRVMGVKCAPPGAPKPHNYCSF